MKVEYFDYHVHLAFCYHTHLIQLHLLGLSSCVSLRYLQRLKQGILFVQYTVGSIKGNEWEGGGNSTLVINICNNIREYIKILFKKFSRDTATSSSFRNVKSIHNVLYIIIAQRKK